MTQTTPPSAKQVVRLVLMLSSVAMLVLAGLTFAGVLGLPPLLGYLFIAVAVIDLAMGFVVFKD